MITSRSTGWSTLSTGALSALARPVAPALRRVERRQGMWVGWGTSVSGGAGKEVGGPGGGAACERAAHHPATPASIPLRTRAPPAPARRSQARGGGWRSWNHPGGDQIKLFGGNDVSVQYRMIHPFHAGNAGILNKMPRVGRLAEYRQDYSFGARPTSARAVCGLAWHPPPSTFDSKVYQRRLLPARAARAPRLTSPSPPRQARLSSATLLRRSARS
jgi:hypothetical protein